MKIELFPDIFEILTKSGKSKENKTEFEKSANAKLLGAFQQFQNSFFFYKWLVTPII